MHALCGKEKDEHVGGRGESREETEREIKREGGREREREGE